MCKVAELMVFSAFLQLCINVANEQLQYLFNDHVFAWLQQVRWCLLGRRRGNGGRSSCHEKR